MAWEHSKQFMGFSALFFITFTGTYNAVVINQESTILSQEMKFVKRLDEIYGVVRPARQVAASPNLLRPTLVPTQHKIRPLLKPVVQEVRQVQAAPAQNTAPESSERTAAAVQEDLEMSIVDVVNPKLWPQGIKSGQLGLAGSLRTNNGQIEADISLPNGQNITASSEMIGNVFQYDLNGQTYGAIIYQVDQTSYIVNLSDGPLEGTRFKFLLPPSEDQYLAAYPADEQVTDNISTEYSAPSIPQDLSWAQNQIFDPGMQTGGQIQESKEYDQSMQAEAERAQLMYEQGLQQNGALNALNQTEVY